MKRIANLFLLSLALVIGLRPVSAANFSVLAGSDYFATQPGTTFAGVAFNGVPTGPGNTDTIIERTQTVQLGTGAPATGTTPLLMTQLELVSATQFSFMGGPVGFYYVTLQSVHGGPASTGTMTINLTSNDDHSPANPEGNFSSSIDVFFDVRLGSANGTIVNSSDLVLTSSLTNWDANPTPLDLLVPGLVGDVTANFHTNKIQNVDLNQMDFFPVGAVTESHPTGATHVVTNTQTPEPGTIALFGTALLVLWPLRRQA
jgi:hypothetical protein